MVEFRPQKQKYQCQDCRRQFVENPTNKVIDQETKELIDGARVATDTVREVKKGLTWVSVT